jgi:hypothetical protein
MEGAAKGGIARGRLLPGAFLLGLFLAFATSKEASLFPAIGLFSEPPFATEIQNKTSMDVNSTLDLEIASPFREDRILVVFSGPTSMDRTPRDKNRHELYHRNMEYFITHGVDCRNQDTVLTVTSEVEPHYQDRIQKLNVEECLPHNHSVQLLVRENVCYDMETMRAVLFNSTLDIASYDYFVFVNCGMSGPFLTDQSKQLPWTYQLLSLLSDEVRMSGLSINCPRAPGRQHIQSFVYALDKVGLQVVVNASAIYDCRVESSRYAQLVRRYEIGMGQAILKAGYGLSSLLPYAVLMPENYTQCGIWDFWDKVGLLERFGHILTWNETLFFKSSRLLPKDIAEKIDYPGEPHWRHVRRQLIRS